MTPNRLWIGIFALWGVLLLKSPGAVQALELRSLLGARQGQIDRFENQIISLQDQADRLEKSRVTQEREIRRVLGYTSPRDLVFDFN